MPKPKIDRVQLSQLLRRGKSQKEVAQFFGVTESAISRCKKEMNLSVVKNVALENAGRVVDKSLNVVDQLSKINEAANELLDDIEREPDLRLKAVSEIRGQLKRQHEILKSLHDIEAVQTFQVEVLNCIGQASPEVKNEIIRRLNEKRALRTAVRFDP